MNDAAGHGIEQPPRLPAQDGVCYVRSDHSQTEALPSALAYHR